MSTKVSIGAIDIGKGMPALMIAEIGLNHNGSADLAHKLIDEAALSGANVVKFQKRSPADLATAEFIDQPFLKCPLFGRTQRQVRERLELTEAELVELKKHADSLGLYFCVSAFDLPSLETVIRLGGLLKIASHSITNGPLLERVKEAGVPVVMSTGGASPEEIERAVDILEDNPLILLHCVSAYPTPDQLVCLDTIPYLRDKYELPVGFSGHEKGIELSVAAATLGACVIERHFTLNRSMMGLDHGISLEPLEFAQMVRNIRRIESARGVSKTVFPEENPARLNYHVAVCSARDIKKGEILRREDLVCKQPLRDAGRFFTGLELAGVIGREIVEDIKIDTPVPREIIK
ncbi:N-acetylneuraminate synthase family protein [Maridesulfovibrio hydrothermalis]|uniref:N-acetylneuraminate synthase n=1 Tax=Maridesulfovibrio hydrothermalis AM13 = DSM 14728 TaxID=1121451 RepID=L0RBI9_9BACT|nr:N-acetylneuraminate synthase family protein [Maridesulfovibrio hydrothermalis]CCO23592.1 N-acetylneuraminate synthase [Maridesulfovibrio hydrothermalis AM13 = DSM 14728]